MSRYHCRSSQATIEGSKKTMLFEARLFLLTKLATKTGKISLKRWSQQKNIKKIVIIFCFKRIHENRDFHILQIRFDFL